MNLPTKKQVERLEKIEIILSEKAVKERFDVKFPGGDFTKLTKEQAQTLIESFYPQISQDVIFNVAYTKSLIDYMREEYGVEFDSEDNKIYKLKYLDYFIDLISCTVDIGDRKSYINRYNFYDLASWLVMKYQLASKDEILERNAKDLFKLKSGL
jgi:hypothetical protein